MRAHTDTYICMFFPGGGKTAVFLKFDYFFKNKK